ncbi:uncharacterized protein LOC105386545 isoform X2 [Plutella xylostella]|uniref:uncharacterized protein LOC105386545 isoform X2 n=1 Tax=Plutella xylostella TaxID=51655 RepID=UPI00203282B1|nr:uncharacterized protein LOC105386545 isoform X2 [Plutella xylostella]
MIIALQTLIFFRHTLVTVFHRFLRPYYRIFQLTFPKQESEEEEDGADEQVFADYHSKKGVVFFPPVYVQRYAAVTDCLMENEWSGKLHKVVELGYHDLSFMKYLKEVPGIQTILGVDLDGMALRCSSDLLSDDYPDDGKDPLTITLFQGNAADPDYRLIGCDAVISIEMIEHMLPHDLERLVHTVFGFIKPWVAIFTTPNGDFNELFLSMEKNGLRRLDHFFEWSREQFNEWCANIVLRYPSYSVSCRGVGPGPPGTRQLGCCSQLAVFVNNHYQRQRDLDVNCLQMDAKSPEQESLTQILNCGDSSGSSGDAKTCVMAPTMESFSDIIYRPSSMTVLDSSSSLSQDSLKGFDKTSQCNLDQEVARNYLMFDDDETKFTILVPRRRKEFKVYEMGDIVSRLNCSTYTVTKFSKTTRHLMEKHKKIRSPSATSEIVNEIKCISEMMELQTQNAPGAPIWSNYYWGYNAPYWNQYYKVVQEYKYPLKAHQSKEETILDLLSFEITRLVDSQQDDDMSGENRLRIPLKRLVVIVKHITDDVDRIRDILEWNGYQIEDDCVVHERVLDDGDEDDDDDDDWTITIKDHEASDFNMTDVYSCGFSDASSSFDMYGASLQRSIYRKLRKLRTMIPSTKEVNLELDAVVCRLMKLAIRSSGQHCAPPPQWMQRKLYDLLTLTEKAIERRRARFIRNFAGIDHDEEKSRSLLIINKYKEQDTKVKQIEDHYGYLVTEHSPVSTINYDEDKRSSTLTLKETESEVSDASKKHIPDCEGTDLLDFVESGIYDSDSKEDKTETWINIKSYALSPICNEIFYSPKMITSRRFKTGLVRKRLKSKTAIHKIRRKNRIKHIIGNKLKFVKRLTRSLPSGREANSKIPYSASANVINDNRQMWRNFRSNYSKPIPLSLINLCHPELFTQKYIKNFWSGRKDQRHVASIVLANATIETDCATKESQLVSISMDGGEEMKALHKTTVDVDGEVSLLAEESVIKNNIGGTHNSIDCMSTQTIYLCDVNEPSTSKGIRRSIIDTQCGPDTVMTSYSREMLMQRLNKRTDFGTSMYDCKDNTSWNKLHTGIHIKDSVTDTQRNSEELNIEIPVAEKKPLLNYDVNYVTDTKTQSSKSYVSTSTLNDICNNNDIINLKESKPSKNDVRNHNTQQRNSKHLISIGAQIHSFTGRNNSHDILYQGTWQQRYIYCNKTNQQKCTVKYTKKKESKENIPPKTKDKKTTVVQRSRKNIIKTGKENCSEVENIGNVKSSRPLKKPVLALPKSIKTNSGSVKVKTFKNASADILKSLKETKRSLSRISKHETRPPVENLTNDTEVLTGSKGVSIVQPKITKAKPLLTIKSNKIPVDIPQLPSIFHQKPILAPVPSFYVKKNISDDKIQNLTPIKCKNNEPDIEYTSNSLAKTYGSHPIDIADLSNTAQKNTSNLVVNPKTETVLDRTNSSELSINTFKNDNTDHTAAALKKSISEIQKDLLNFKYEGHQELLVYCNEVQSFSSDYPSDCSKIEYMEEKEKNVENDLNVRPRSAASSCSTPNSVITVRSIKIHKPISAVNLVDYDKSVKDEHGEILNATSENKQKSKEFESKIVENENSENIQNNMNPYHKCTEEQVLVAQVTSESPVIPIQPKDNFIVNIPSLSISRENDKTIISNENESLSTNNSLVACYKKTIENNSSKDNDSKSDTCKDIIKGSNNSKPDCFVELVTEVRKWIDESLNFIGGKNTFLKEGSPEESVLDDTFGLNTAFSEISTNEPDGTSTLTETDCLSYRSIHSISSYSDAYFGDNELNSVGTLKVEDSSVTGIFERQKRVTLQASEEVFVSGRSSDSYASCTLDEDVVIPDWLFAIIANNDGNEPLPFEIPIDLLEDGILDVNGNILEPGVGIAAGAGDGRGIHSDQHDSSGQGTSLDSTSTDSSGPHSEIGESSSSSSSMSSTVIIQGPGAGDGTDVLSDDSSDGDDDDDSGSSSSRTSAENRHQTILIDAARFSARYGVLPDNGSSGSYRTIDDEDAFAIRGHHLSPRPRSEGSDSDADVSSLATDTSHEARAHSDPEQQTRRRNPSDPPAAPADPTDTLGADNDPSDRRSDVRNQMQDETS